MSKKTSKTVKLKTKSKSKSTISKKKTSTKKNISEVKKKTSAKNLTTEVNKTSTNTKRKKKNANLSRLHSEMNKMVFDAVDREVIKRFKIIIDTSEDDISKVNLSQLLKEPKSVDLSIFDENLLAYIKHYLFMKKRLNK